LEEGTEKKKKENEKENNKNKRKEEKKFTFDLVLKSGLITAGEFYRKKN